MQNHCQSDQFSPLLKAPTPLEQQCLWQIVQAHTELMLVLKTLRKLDTTAYVAAGVLRHVVWAHLHEMSYSLSGTEIDVIFYDQDDVNDQHALRLKHALEMQLPNIQWDVTNQATVHQWYRTEKNQSIAPLQSIAQALYFWPETATALALRLDQQQDFELIAPLGLQDLFELKLRWNPTLVSYKIFEQRCLNKRFLEKWPRLKLISH
jgi:uncharacterized protein